MSLFFFLFFVFNTYATTRKRKREGNPSLSAGLIARQRQLRRGNHSACSLAKDKAANSAFHWKEKEKRTSLRSLIAGVPRTAPRTSHIRMLVYSSMAMPMNPAMQRGNKHDPSHSDAAHAFCCTSRE